MGRTHTHKNASTDAMVPMRLLDEMNPIVTKIDLFKESHSFYTKFNIIERILNMIQQHFLK